jgi:hypothetical protein
MLRYSGVLNVNRKRDKMLVIKWPAPMRMFIASIGFSSIFLTGCATLEQTWRNDVADLAPAVRSCAEHFSVLDQTIDRAGVRDAQAHRLTGFPYLRVDRYTASLNDLASMDWDARAQAQWLSRLQTLDQVARLVEIGNLPDQDIRALQADGSGRTALFNKTVQCAERLREQDASQPGRLALIRERAYVPDNYQTWQRVIGLYGLSHIPFAIGIEKWQRQTKLDFERAPELREKVSAAYRYTMPSDSMMTREQIAATIRRASDNPLHIPELNGEEKLTLARAFAPVFKLETGAEYDRIGRLRWGSGSTPELDMAEPVVYYRIALTRLGGQTLVQLVYTVWFSQRPPQYEHDMYAGKLDGVVLRMTLNANGDPLVYDSIHPCGCYHLFFPTPLVQAIPAPPGTGEWAFVPTSLPAHTVGTRVAVEIATGTHYLRSIRLEPASLGRNYQLVPEDALRALPTAHGTRSIYGPDGLVPGTERAERWLFWPMGVPSAGAMRQWGHHATAFVGRRHFDDADLLEKRFRIVAP